MKIKKVTISAFLIITVVFAFSAAPLFASAANFNVSEQNPAEITTPFGVDKPISIWNVSDKGSYDFGGEADHSTLYTEYLFTGATSYIIKVNNYGSSNITVKVKSNAIPDTTYGTFTSYSGSAYGYFTVSGMKASDKIYIEFSAPCKFDDWIALNQAR